MNQQLKCTEMLLRNFLYSLEHCIAPSYHKVTVASLCLTFNWSSILLVTSTFLFLLRMKSILVANKHNVLFIHISSFFAHLTDSSIMYFPLLTHPSHPTLARKLLFLMTSIYARAAAHSKNRIVILTINLSRSLQMSESI